MPSLGLFRRREIWLPTWKGWLALGLFALALGVTAITFTVPFLAPVLPQSRGILVVEGWLPDYALEEAKRTFETHPYERMVVTGVPIELGFHISKEKNYAQLAATTLKHLGLREDAVVTVSSPEVRRDRTYSTSRQVRTWLDRNKPGVPVDVFTLGVHARRSWLLYRLGLGSGYTVGVIAARDERFDPDEWWKTSSGFRTVSSEALAYVYAKLFFRPSRAPGPEPAAELSLDNPPPARRPKP